jgi:hypothetical protein
MQPYQPPVELYQKLSPLLQESLDYTNSEHLKKQLAELEVLGYEVSAKRTEWFQKLLESRERVRIPKDKEFTELDRKTMLQASTAVIEHDHEFLISLEKIIESRLELGSLFLRTTGR